MKQPERTELKEWPDWLVQLGPGMDLLLEAIDRHRGDLLHDCGDSHVYRRLGQAQVREFEEKAQQLGILAPNRQLRFDKAKQLDLPPSSLRAMVYNVGQRHHTVRAYLHANKVFLLKMLADMPVAFQRGNLFGGFASIRSVLECLGDLCRSADLLGEVKDASDAHWMGRKFNETINADLASRLDWARMSSVEFRSHDDLSSFRTAASAKEGLFDPARGIRSLQKRVRGVVPAYEVLIELSQPRVGTLWLLYEESKSMPDRAKTIWNRNKIGAGFPRTMTGEMRPIIVQIFDVLYACLPVLKQLDKEFADIDGRMARATQDEVRTMLWHFPDLFDKHEDCPCGSGKRVKYCCGE